MKNKLFLLVVLAAVGCSIAREPRAGSQTHFLRSCSATCAAPYSCLCGVCSLPCEDSALCTAEAPAAACIAHGAANSCDDAPPRVCDVECQTDLECSPLGTGFRCELGRCRGAAEPAPISAMPPGKSTPDAGTNTPGTTPNAGAPCNEAPIDKIDLLFMIDNSNSMSQEQETLKAQFPKLMRVLTSGERFPGDPNAFPAAKDLHVGVVSSDMGIPGIDALGCNPDGGDDGRLQHVPHADGCGDAYPTFLSYAAEQGADPLQLAKNVACIASLGTGGCGFEEQLEAPLKALWPSAFRDVNGNVVTPNPITFLSTTPQGTLGHGDVPAAQGGNAGFLRNDRATGLSLIVIVVVTDEDDCSPRTTEFLKPPAQLSMDSPYYAQDISLRCFYNPSLLYDVSLRYLNGFKQLRPGNEELVAFAAITGVPPDLADNETLNAIDFSNTPSRDKFYDNILNDPRMQQTVDPSTNPGQNRGTGDLMPSCVRTDATGNVSTAFPPRRIVQLAKGFGENGIVQSICQDDFGPAMDNIINLMAKRIGTGNSCAH